MAEIVPLHQQQPLRRPTGLSKACSDEDLLNAVKAYLCGAQEEEVRRHLKVAAGTTAYWINTREFRDLVNDQLVDISETIKHRLIRVSAKALTQLDDRLENGNAIYSMDGEQIGTRPLNTKELTDITRTVMDQARALEKGLPGKTDDGDKMNLVSLARSLKKLAQDSEIEVKAERLD